MKNLQRLQIESQEKTSANREETIRKVVKPVELTSNAVSSAQSTSNPKSTETTERAKENTLESRKKKRQRVPSPPQDEIISSRPKRQCTQNARYDMVLRIPRLNPERVKSLRSQAAADFPQGLFRFHYKFLFQFIPNKSS